MEFGIITVRSHRNSEPDPNLLANFKRNLARAAYEDILLMFWMVKNIKKTMFN